MSLLSEERKQVIIDEIEMHGKVRVTDLAKKFNVSTETIRRDLEVLEKSEKLKRVYGGAIKQTYDYGEPPFGQREILNQVEKMAIGKKASSLINDGDTIFLNAGTTTIEIAKFIEGFKRLTIITNSLAVANLLRDSLSQGLFRGKVIMIGGEIAPDQQAVSGNISEEMIKRFYFDKAFLAVGGISIKTGISDYDLNESAITRLVLLNSKEVFVLADHSKIGVQSFIHISNLDMVDAIICDKKPPASWTANLDQNSVDWIVP